MEFLKIIIDLYIMGFTNEFVYLKKCLIIWHIKRKL